MATPTTAIEIEMAMRTYQKYIERWSNDFNELCCKPIMSLLIKRMFLQRPHTDDMMQMCIDLGIDIPDFQPVSFDGLTFRFR